jgi:predicted anti-sigma-YlaC factor YlaD
MPPGNLTCKELVELVTDYLEGKLSTHDHTRFENHIDACQGCRAYLEQMRITIELVGKLEEDAIPDDAEEELRRAFRDWDDSA